MIQVCLSADWPLALQLTHFLILVQSLESDPAITTNAKQRFPLVLFRLNGDYPKIEVQMGWITVANFYHSNFNFETPIFTSCVAIET